MELVWGYLAYSAIKLVGYSFAAFLMCRAYGKKWYWCFPVGLTRTLMGQLFGFGVAIITSPFIIALGDFTATGFVLIPVRAVEWWLIVRIFYDNAGADKQRQARSIFLGIIWSFILDVPVWTQLVNVPGLRIC